jgi:Cu+-exporting ATPase
MTVGPDTTPYRAEYAGKTYYFCSATCRTKFTTAPARYLADVAEHADGVDAATETATDPVCGMAVDPATTSYRYKYQGRTYFFCADRSRTNFAADPTRYLEGKAALLADTHCCTGTTGGCSLAYSST